MSENEIKILLALTSNVRLNALMLDRANELKETELCIKYPEKQHIIIDKEYEEVKDNMLKGTQPYTIKSFEQKNRKEKNNGQHRRL